MKRTIQKWLSFFTDVQIDYRDSAINGDLIVLMVKGKYQLCTANAIYSFETKYDNFGNIFAGHIDMDKIPGDQVLVLGLGLGSVPQILDSISPGKWNFSAVELDPDVCELAAIYGYSLLESSIQTSITDASVFVQISEEKYDLICIDLFVDDKIPETCATRDFLSSVKDLLNPKGLVVANTLAFSDQHKEWSKRYFNEIFSDIFQEACIIHTHKNYMMINSKYHLVDVYDKEVIA